MGGREAADRVVAALDHHLQVVGVGDEGHLDLAVLVGGELDLLVERQRLPGAADVAGLQVGGAEVEAQPRQRLQHVTLRGQRRDLDHVQVALVDGLGDGELGAHPDRHAAQRPR